MASKWFEEPEGKKKQEPKASETSKPLWPTAADSQRQETPIYDEVARNHDR